MTTQNIDAIRFYQDTFNQVRDKNVAMFLTVAHIFSVRLVEVVGILGQVVNRLQVIGDHLNTLNEITESDK